MASIYHTVNIRVPVDKVWEYLTSEENYPEYIAGYLSDGRGNIKDQDPDTFYWSADLRLVKIPVTETITEIRDQESIVYRGTILGQNFQTIIEFSDNQGDCEIRVTISYHISWYLLNGLTDRLLIDPITRKYLRASLEEAKSRLESDGN